MRDRLLPFDPSINIGPLEPPLATYFKRGQLTPLSHGVDSLVRNFQPSSDLGQR
jgi:hypothetical protein